MEVKEWLAYTSKEILDAREKDKVLQITRRELECNDGLTLSVQASEFHFCEPKEVCETYESVEIYAHGDVLLELEELDYNMIDSVYKYVGIDALEYLVAVHGGMKEIV